MKAWIVREYDVEACEVVFAETRGKAKTIALDVGTFDDADFCALEGHRVPEIDKYYTDGKRYMNWGNQKDRLALVKECGFSCVDDCFGEFCEDCLSKDYCDRYDEFCARFDVYIEETETKLKENNKNDNTNLQTER